MMETILTFETTVYINGDISQKAVIFILAVRT
jgi:hypothetical protein